MTAKIKSKRHEKDFSSGRYLHPPMDKITRYLGIWRVFADRRNSSIYLSICLKYLNTSIAASIHPRGACLSLLILMGGKGSCQFYSPIGVCSGVFCVFWYLGQNPLSSIDLLKTSGLAYPPFDKGMCGI